MPVDRSLSTYPPLGTWQRQILEEQHEARASSNLREWQAFQAGYAAAAAGRALSELPPLLAPDSLEAHAWRIGSMVYSRQHSARIGATTS